MQSHDGIPADIQGESMHKLATVRVGDSDPLKANNIHGWGETIQAQETLLLSSNQAVVLANHRRRLLASVRASLTINVLRPMRLSTSWISSRRLDP